MTAVLYEARNQVASCSECQHLTRMKLGLGYLGKSIMDLVTSITGWCNLSLGSAEHT